MANRSENGVRVGFPVPHPGRPTAADPTIHRPPPPNPITELSSAPTTRETGATALTILPPESLVAAITPLPTLGRKRSLPVPPPPHAFHRTRPVN